MVGGLSGGEGATGAGDDAGGDGVLILTEGVADGDDLFADGDGLRIAESGSGEVFGVLDFEERDVVERVSADEFNVLIDCAVVKNDVDF